MADGYQVMMCWPSNRNEIKYLNQRTDTKFAPTVEHTLSECDGCGRGIWIGPQQLQLVGSPFVRARKLCLFCCSTVHTTLRLAPKEVDVNPDLRYARRRT